MMSLIHKSHLWRTLTLLVTLAGALARDARASTVIPQQSKGSASARRCAQCAPRDAERDRHERLLMKIDSLKHEFEHERLSESQRGRLAEELRRTVFALEESIERANAVAQAGVETPEPMRVMPEIVAMEGPFRTRGYLGVVFDGTSKDMWRNNERIVYFYQHPRVALVEGGSPAERAGVLQGDTLLALNGNDVREREISLTKLLVPNHRIMVRVLRAGGLKDIPVTIGEAPGYVVGRAAPVAPMSPAPGSPRSQVRVWGNPGRPVPMPPVPPQEPVPGTPPAMSSVWGFNEGVAGAKVETISEGLGRAVGVKAGVLVIRSAPGTPAFRSGLRDGDVIVRVGGRTVTTVRELRGMLERHDDDFVRLEIVRERKERDLTLRWP
jgi:hypothetical protein